MNIAQIHMLSRVLRPKHLPALRRLHSPTPPGPALVLLSGGLDSAVTLALARKEHTEILALTFDYGQKGASHELAAAARVAKALKADDHRTIAIDPKTFYGSSALTSYNVQVPKCPGMMDGSDVPVGKTPVTYVPARNLIFLAYATAVAEGMKAKEAYIGANVVDYSGYPDCRPEFFEAFEKVCEIGTKPGLEGWGLNVRTPLIGMSKMEIVKRGMELNVDFASTHSCYDVDDQGRPCGLCDSCRLRRTAFLKLGFKEDPAIAAHQ